jgi:FkbM family methyltransferase
VPVFKVYHLAAGVPEMLKSYLKSAARRLGFDLQRFHPARSQAAQLRAMLSFHKINLIFDVGANSGQYGRELRGSIGYRGRIVSFEPMAAAHSALARLAATDRLWEVAPRTAIGAKDGTTVINVSGNSVSSSILPMLESHADAAPDSRYFASEEVPLATLDKVAVPYFRHDSVAFLKIDTQGYELEVLRGAEDTLSRIVGMQMELSLIPLYEGQKLMPEMLAEVANLGFELWGISPTFAAPATGRMLQVDATFFKYPDSFELSRQ